jgi:hypothetical protein
MCGIAGFWQTKRLTESPLDVLERIGAGWQEDLLSPESLKLGGFLNPNPIREKWEEHVSGARNWEYPLWNALMFQVWVSSSTRTLSGPQLAGPRIS